MKAILGVVLLVAAATASFTGDLKPRHIDPSIPRILVHQRLQQRITNGEVASEKQFPYQVGLWLAFDGGTAFCGGTLISNRWIVTAAHCTDAAYNVTVILGTTKLNEKEPGEQTIFVPKSGLIVHEDWQPDLIRGDIALIKLPLEVPFTPYVQPAKLPKKSDSYSNYVDDIAVASGWGKDSDAATAVSPVLRYIESRVITKSACNIRYFGLIQESNICITGENGRSTCNGDSGGPLVHKEGDDNILIGATSFGLSLGCEVGWPAVFTRITSYLDWIEAKTGIVNK